jgi:hypothetical protein
MVSKLYPFLNLPWKHMWSNSRFKWQNMETHSLERPDVAEQTCIERQAIYIRGQYNFVPSQSLNGSNNRVL